MTILGLRMVRILVTKVLWLLDKDEEEEDEVTEVDTTTCCCFCC